jgi:hypothetical protein
MRVFREGQGYVALPKLPHSSLSLHEMEDGLWPPLGA